MLHMVKNAFSRDLLDKGLLQNTAGAILMFWTLRAAVRSVRVPFSSCIACGAKSGIAKVV